MSWFDGVIMVPAFNGQKPCKPHTMETRNYLTEQLHELGEYALGPVRRLSSSR